MDSLRFQIPSWPYPFNPQHIAIWVFKSAQVYWSPLETVITEEAGFVEHSSQIADWMYAIQRKEGIIALDIKAFHFHLRWLPLASPCRHIFLFPAARTYSSPNTSHLLHQAVYKCGNPQQPAPSNRLLQLLQINSGMHATLQVCFVLKFITGKIESNLHHWVLL